METISNELAEENRPEIEQRELYNIAEEIHDQIPSEAIDLPLESDLINHETPDSITPDSDKEDHDPGKESEKGPTVTPDEMVKRGDHKSSERW